MTPHNKIIMTRMQKDKCGNLTFSSRKISISVVNSLDMLTGMQHKRYKSTAEVFNLTGWSLLCFVKHDALL